MFDEDRDQRELVQATLLGRVSEYGIRVIRQVSDQLQMQLIVRNRSGLSVLARSFARNGCWSVAEIDDLVMELQHQVLQHLSLTQGVQLTLSATD